MLDTIDVPAEVWWKEYYREGAVPDAVCDDYGKLPSVLKGLNC